MISKRNIKYWQDGDLFYAEWSDHALDDEDRYKEGSIIFTASVPAGRHEFDRAKAAVTALFDKWVKETRQ